MCFKALPVTREGDIHEVFIIPKVLERAGNATLVVVPPEAEVLCVHHLELANYRVMWYLRKEKNSFITMEYNNPYLIL